MGRVSDLGSCGIVLRSELVQGGSMGGMGEGGGGGGDAPGQNKK
jgi:hypothetical protein